jgi:SAM-dependent methyltransferase
MGQKASYDPLSRFTDRAELYARCRPSYPDSALEFVVMRCELLPGASIADIGSGTGIASRQMARRGFQIIGIEPNERMRGFAEAESVPEEFPQPRYRGGTAEATGLADSSVDAVLCAQAFHWFKPDAALAEFHRILKPGRWVALLWNERDESDAFTAAYGDALRCAPDTAAIEASRANAGDALLRSPIFDAAERIIFKHSQALDEDGVLGRVFSTSYAPKEPAAVEKLRTALREAVRRHERNGQVTMCYDTLVYVARRS